MSYDPYAVMLAQHDREQQVAHAAQYRLAVWHRARRARCPLLRPVAQLFVRLGRALGADTDLETLHMARHR